MQAPRARRLRRAAVTILVATMPAGVAAIAVATPAAAQPAGTVYASVSGTPSDACTQADPCDLGTALVAVAAGGTVALTTPGDATAASRYVGNWTVNTPGTSAGAPVTITAAPGLASQPILDGDRSTAPAGESCSTASCQGSVLTVPTGEYVDVSGITIADGNNLAYPGGGGAIHNDGTAAIDHVTFTDNYAYDNGGAIDSADGDSASLLVTSSTFTDNSCSGGDAGAIDSGASGNGQLTVTASSFTDNACAETGGAIDNGDFGGGQATITASTFIGNRGLYGGAINNAGHSSASMTVTDSTFAGNIAQDEGDGGAIDTSDYGGNGSLTVTASTFVGNSAPGGDGDTIDAGDESGSGTVAIAGDLFAGSCDQAGGTWHDGGFNAADGSTCFSGSSPGVDIAQGPVGSDLQAQPTDNGGPTLTVEPTSGNPAIGLVEDIGPFNLNGTQIRLCPTVDQRGYASAPNTDCDAGAVQTNGAAPGLSVGAAAAPGGYRQAGDALALTYRVTNTGASSLDDVGVTDSLGSSIACPSDSLTPGTAETCTGSYSVTGPDAAAGQLSDTATAVGTVADGVPVGSTSPTVAVQAAWPTAVSGTTRPAPAAAGPAYYLGVTGSYLAKAGATWTLLVTGPATGRHTFSGTMTVNGRSLGGVTPISLGTHGAVSVAGKSATFSIPDTGQVRGFRIVTSAATTSATFSLSIDGVPATADQIYQGSPAIAANTDSPISYARP